MNESLADAKRLVRAELGQQAHHMTVNSVARQLVEGRALLARAVAGENLGCFFTLWQMRRRKLFKPLDDVGAEITRIIASGVTQRRQLKGVPAEPPPRIGEIYVIGTSEFVKIGFSTDHQQRLRALRAASPTRLQLLDVRAGSMADEAALHRRFASYRLRNEWFRREGELAAWIKAGCPR